MRSPASRMLATAFALLACMVFVSLCLTSSAFAAGETIQLEQTLVGNNTELTSLSMPSESIPTYVMKYRCDSTADPCQGNVLTVTIPTGLSIHTVGTSAHVTNISGTGQTRTFTMSDLAPGATGAISIELVIPGVTTSDGTAWTWTSSMTGTNTPTETSNAVTLTARAASQTNAAGSKLSGGAIDGLARYRVQGCNNRKTPTSTWGPLGVLAGSELYVTLPDGATVVDAAGGTPSTVSGVRRLTWTVGAMGAGCANYEIVLAYPVSDPSNVVGASKQLDIAWSGKLVGESADHPLGTASISHTLTAPSSSISPWKRVATPRVTNGTPRATVSDLVTYDLGGENSGTATLDDYTIDDPMPDGVNVQGLDAYNPGRQAGQLWIATKFGADGVEGTSDDGQLALHPAPVPARGSLTLSFALLPAGDYVTRLKIRAVEIRPSDGGTFLRVRTKVLAESRSGVEALEGTVISNDADYTYAATINGTQSSQSTTQSASFTIDMPSAGLFVRNNGGTVPSGQRVTPEMTLMAVPVVDNDLANPVFMLQLPPGFTLETWTGPTNLPAATLTTVTNWKGTQDTLIRWTFPRGTIAAKDTTYIFKYKLRLARNIYSTKNIKGYIHSSTQPVTCYQNFFDGSPDTDDRDNDGNTTEVLCPWFAQVDHPTSSAAILTSKVKGAWDSAFVPGPGTGRSKPGAEDTYQVTLESQATMNLDRVSVIDVLPRPGDTGVLNGAQRNPTSRTFPVKLRARPTMPTLTGAVTTYYTTVDTPCRSEYGFTAAGCNAPNWTDWDQTPPTDIADVTAVKIDFGTNVLTPGDEWVVELPVTTPTTGATEVDRADYNPSPLLPANDEIARNSAAFEVRRTDINAVLLPSESLQNGLRMPSIYGPADQPLTASNKTSSGVGTHPHETTLSIPDGGSIALIDGGQPVTRITKPGIGVYDLDQTTGILTFTPEVGYVGTPPAITYRRTNVFGTTADATYIPTVTRPAGPTAPALTSTGPVVTPQDRTVTVPAGGTVRLLDGTTPVTTLTVPGEGRYDLDTTTGKVTFTPVRGFSGQATGVAYRITDGYNQADQSTYVPTVTRPAGPSAPPKTTSGVGTEVHKTSVTVPDHGRVRLVTPQGTEVTELTLPGKGRFTLNPATGEITFTPDPGFKGEVVVPYRATDEYGSHETGSYTAKVTAPAGPTAPPKQTSGVGTAAHKEKLPVPAGGRARLLDPQGTETTDLDVPGQGHYVLDPATGEITFTPVPGFKGDAKVPYRLTDEYGTTADGVYTQEVTAPPAPTATPERSVGRPGEGQARVVTVPVGGRIELVGPDGQTVKELRVAGQGIYRVDPATGVLTFSPDKGFTGTPKPVTYRVVDAYGQSVDASYQPTVTGSTTGDPVGCLSRRAQTLHWKVPASTKLKSTRMLLNGKQVAVFRRDVRSATVDMRGRPKQTIKVEIIGTTTSGRTLSNTRTYRTCRTKLTHPPLKTLQLAAAPSSR